jgi:hypothetical protein
VNGLFKAQLIYVSTLALLILTLAIQPLGPSDGWV